MAQNKRTTGFHSYEVQKHAKLNSLLFKNTFLCGKTGKESKEMINTKLGVEES